MKKENNISSIDFFDFDVFALPDQKFGLKNKKNTTQQEILVVYSNENDDPVLEELLRNILSAANLDIENGIVFLKTTPQERYSFHEINEKLSLKDLLFFGIPPSNFGLNYIVKHYQPLSVKKWRMLLINSLEEVHTDVNKKKALWSCLKEMYLQNKEAQT